MGVNEIAGDFWNSELGKILLIYFMYVMTLIVMCRQIILGVAVAGVDGRSRRGDADALLALGPSRPRFAE